MGWRRLAFVAAAAAAAGAGCGPRATGAAVLSVGSFDELEDAVAGLRDGDTLELNETIIVTSTLVIQSVAGVTLTSALGGRYALEGDGETPLMQIGKARVNVSNVIFRNGRGTELEPAALLVRSESTVFMDSVTFAENRVFVPTLAGGAVTVSASTVSMTNCDFRENMVAGGEGGSAMRTEHADVYLESCMFQSNVAESGVGGALHISAASSVVVNSSDFRDNRNQAPFSGGAVTINAHAEYDESVTFINCRFVDNEGASGSRDVDFVFDYLGPDIFEILSACPADTYDAAASGTLSCNDCPGGPYPARFSGSCSPCEFYSPQPGGWACRPARCSSMQAVASTFCADGTNRSGLLIDDAASTTCAGAPGPQCVEDDVATCCAASCSTIEDADDFCGGDGYGRGLVEYAFTASCLGSECNQTADAATCCATTTTTSTRTTSATGTETATTTTGTSTSTSTSTRSTTIPNTTTTTTTSRSTTTRTTTTRSSTTTRTVTSTVTSTSTTSTSTTETNTTTTTSSTTSTTTTTSTEGRFADRRQRAAIGGATLFHVGSLAAAVAMFALLLPQA